MPANRPSRRPSREGGRSRRESRPNVFVQTEQPAKSGAAVAAEAIPVQTNGAVATEPPDSAVITARRRAARVRPGRPRSEVFTRTLGRELRQLAALTALSVAVLIVLAFVLR